MEICKAGGLTFEVCSFAEPSRIESSSRLQHP